jgi:hypothetical protein
MLPPVPDAFFPVWRYKVNAHPTWGLQRRWDRTMVGHRIHRRGTDRTAREDKR